MSILRKRLAAVSLLALAGCVMVQERPPEETFSVIERGSIPPERAGAFVDCLVDGFGTAKVAPRSYGTRVELATNAAYILLSAEVWSTGKVELLQTSYAYAGAPEGRAAFIGCLERFR